MAYTDDNKVGRFFKVFSSEESSTELLIPVKFAGENKHVLTEKFKLETEYNAHSWKVEMEQRNEELYFTKGWLKFVKDNTLDINFLVFELIKKSTFKVLIFNLTGCEEEFASTPAAARETNIGSPRFSLKLKKYHKYYVSIPAKFAAKARLADKMEITLVDRRGDRWPVAIIKQCSPHRFQTHTGWNEFIAAQKLRVGSEILIGSMAGSKNDFLVEVLRKDKEGKILKAVDKRRGRLGDRTKVSRITAKSTGRKSKGM